MSSKLLLSVIVCLALLFSFGVSVKDAKADQLMFPWVVKGEKVSTIISVVNTVGVDLPGVYDVASLPLLLHYEYWYKETTDINDTETKCTKKDFTRQTSANDIVTFDAAGRINGGKPMFKDTATNTPYSNLRFDMTDGVPFNTRAFLLVDNTLVEGNTDGTLYGEAMILELNSGAAFGYIAYNASGSQSSPQQADFSDGNDLYGEVIRQLRPGSSDPGGEYTAVVLYNPDSAITKFFVTPIDGGLNFPSAGDNCDNDTSKANQRKGDINAQIQLMTAGYSTDLDGGMYDNDENILSFKTPKNVVCTAAVGLDKLIDAGQYTSWKDSGHQAWAYLITKVGTVDKNADGCFDNSEAQAAIGKLEFSTDFQGQAAAGIVNNFNWLRNNYTVTGSFGGLNMIDDLATGD